VHETLAQECRRLLLHVGRTKKKKKLNNVTYIKSNCSYSFQFDDVLSFDSFSPTPTRQ